MATTLKINANRLNISTHSPQAYLTASSQAFSSRAEPVSFSPNAPGEAAN